MSGRVRTTLPDGRRVTGYRKTLRRNPRSIAAPSEYRLIFMLPPAYVWALTQGQHGPAVSVDQTGNVTVKSFDRDLTMACTATFVQTIAKGRGDMIVSGVMQFGARRDTTQIAHVHGSVLIWRGADKPTHYPPNSHDISK